MEESRLLGWEFLGRGGKVGGERLLGERGPARVRTVKTGCIANQLHFVFHYRVLLLLSNSVP